MTNEHGPVQSFLSISLIAICSKIEENETFSNIDFPKDRTLITSDLIDENKAQCSYMSYNQRT